MHFNAIDLTGQRFGKLVAVEPDGKDNQGRLFWLCTCDCGNTKRIRAAHLRNGAIQSCGCEKYKRIAEKVTHHGYASRGKVKPIYTSWAQMHARCKNPNHNRYYRYGGRGIKVCSQWKTFEGFLKDMGDSWAEGLSIERINNDGNYEPANCKWATQKEQAANRSTSKSSKGKCK